MDVTREILHTVRKIDRKTDAVLSNTAPRIPQLWAAVVGLGVCIIGTNALEHGNIPFLSPMYEQATDYVANNAATTGIWIGDILGNTDRSMPDLPPTAGTIRGLDALQSCRLMVAMRERESSSNYQHPGNWAGYIGAYQFGASALATVGLMHSSDSKAVNSGLPPAHPAFIANAGNWKLRGGKAAYLRDNALQDRAFIALASTNVAAGFNSRALIRIHQDTIAGYVAVAHLKGAGAANNWYLRGKDSRDGNGTRSSDYAKLGEQAISTRSKYCGENTGITSWFGTEQKAQKATPNTPETP